MQGNPRKLVQVALGAVFLMLATPLNLPAAWGQQPTPEQLEVFRSLPPAQQQQILDQIAERKGTSQSPAPASSLELPTTMQRTDGATDKLVESLEKAPRMRAGDTLLLDVAVQQEPDPEAADELPRSLTEYRRRLLDGNPYQLDRMGRLVLQGASPIVLAGLTEPEAARRLNADPQFQDFKFGVRILPV